MEPLRKYVTPLVTLYDIIINKESFVPIQNSENGYYYYNLAQISSFFFIKKLREIGCSTKDIKTYLLAGEKTRFDSF